MPRSRADVLVLGAGAAGLAAARELSQAGLTAIVIEARNRVGGRMLTIRDRAVPIPLELGAEFIHGEAEETFRIVRAAGLLVDELPDQHYESRHGKLSPIADFWGKIDGVRADIGRRLARKQFDESLSEYLRKARYSSNVRGLLVNFVEGYHAARTEKVSARSLAAGDEETTSTHRQFRVVSGYDTVVDWMRHGLEPERIEIRFNSVATEAHWHPGEVVVQCSSTLGVPRESFRAKAAIVALPEAVIHSGTLLFEPALKERRRAAEKIHIGQVFKIILRFRESFWRDTEFLDKRLKQAGSRGQPAPLNFVHSYDAAVPVWWTNLPAQLPLLTGWAGGPKAEVLANDPEPERVNKALDSLSQVLAVPRRRLDEQLESWWLHDWREDPFSRGAYVYLGVEGVPAQKILARPVGRTLFFAGEATDSEQTGTVAGAIASGRRAARELIRSIRD